MGIQKGTMNVLEAREEEMRIREECSKIRPLILVSNITNEGFYLEVEKEKELANK